MVTKIRPKHFGINTSYTFDIEAAAPALLHAVAAEDHDKVRNLLATGADVNAQDEDGRTAIHIAAWLDAADLVQILIDHGADVNARTNNWRNTPLHEATNRETLTVFIEHGADVNASNLIGRTPLHTAVTRASITTQVLLEHGADVNALDKDGETPLHKFMRENPEKQDIQRILLRHGADVNARNKAGNTPNQCSEKSQRRLRLRQTEYFRGNSEGRFDTAVALTALDEDTKTILQYTGLHTQLFKKWRHGDPKNPEKKYKEKFEALEEKYRSEFAKFAKGSPEREQKLRQLKVDCGIRLLLQKKDMTFMRKFSILLKEAANAHENQDAVLQKALEDVAKTVQISADEFYDALLERLSASAMV